MTSHPLNPSAVSKGTKLASEEAQLNPQDCMVYSVADSIRPEFLSNGYITTHSKTLSPPGVAPMACSNIFKFVSRKKIFFSAIKLNDFIAVCLV